VKLVLDGGTVVTGDGTAVLDKTTVIIEGELIKNLGKADKSQANNVDRRIDARDKIIIPGIIDHHVHGVTFTRYGIGEYGPLQPNGAMFHLYKHLAYGTTTVLNVDGLASIEDTEAVNKIQPVRVKTSTLHTPATFKLLRASSQHSEMNKDFHEQLTVEKMLKLGAVAVGQDGGGLGLLRVCYSEIPSAISQITKRNITPMQAWEMLMPILYLHKFLGRAHPLAESTIRQQIENALQNASLSHVLNVEQTIKLIEDIVLERLNLGAESLKQSALLAGKFKAPLIASNNMVTKDILLELADKLGRRLIAAHSGHPSFSKEEALDQARALRAKGALIDVSTCDMHGIRRLYSSNETTFALLKEGLADLLSTDYGGGYWDPIPLFIEKAVEKKAIELPKAIELCTSKVANAIPGLATNRGLVMPGKVADLVLLDAKRISSVYMVIIGGQIVFGPLDRHDGGR
jgi:imidazolonepropionase-like amidohydrolase